MRDYRRVIKVKCKRTKKSIFIKEDRFNPEFHQVLKEAPQPVSLNSFTRNLEAQKAERAKYQPPEALIAAQKEMEEAAVQDGDFAPKAENPSPDPAVKEKTNQTGKVKNEDEEATEIAEAMMKDPMPTSVLSARKWAKKKGMKNVSNETTLDQIREFAEEKSLA